MPIHPEDYIHRIGRTGRAGREGFAAMLVTPKDFKALKAIEKMLKQEIPWIDGAPSEAEPREGAEARPNGNGKHRRGNRAKRGKRPGASGPASPQHSHPRKPVQPVQSPQPQRSAAPRTAMAPNGGMSIATTRGTSRTSRISRNRITASGRAAPWCTALRSSGSKRNAPQASRGKQQGMGDHVPAFMMRPVRVT